MTTEFSRVVDALPGFVWSMFPTGRLDYVNRGCREYVGKQLDERRGIAWRKIIHPADLTRVVKRWKAAVASGEPSKIQVRLRRSDGEYRRFLVEVSPRMDDTDTVGSWYGVGTDVEYCMRLNDEVDQTGLYRFIDAIPALVTLTSADGAMEYCNQLSCEYFGASVEELINYAANDIVHPADIPDVMSTFMRAVQSGKPYDIDQRSRRADGAYRWMHARGLPIRDGQGCITRWCLLFMDVDEQKRNQILLAGEKRLLEMVVAGDPLEEVFTVVCQLVEATIDGSHAAIVLLDPSGTQLELGAASALIPDAIKSAFGAPMSIDSGPVPTAIALNQQVIADDLRSETRWPGAGLAAIAIAHGLHACWANPIKSTADRPLGALAIYCERPRAPTSEDQALIQRFANIISTNIERQRSRLLLDQAFEKVRVSEDRLRATIDTVPGIVWSTGADGSVEFLNQRWSEYTGQSVEDARGEGWIARLHPEDVQPLNDCWGEMLATGKPGSFEARFQRFDGTYRWFLLRAVPVFDVAGKLLNWYGQDTDIDDRKRNERLLEGEKRLLGLIASGANLVLVLNAFCALVQLTLEGTLSSVTLIDRGSAPAASATLQNPRLLLAAAPDVPRSLLNDTDGSMLDERASPVEQCAARNEIVFSPDIGNETRWKAWSVTAFSHGISATLSTPIIDDYGVAVGVFTIFYRTLQPAVSGDDRVVDQLNHLASIALGRAKRHADLKQSEAFLSHGQRVSRTGTFSWCVEANEIVWSDEIYRIGDVDPSVRPDFDLIFSRVHPEDALPLNKVFERQRTNPSDFEHEYRLKMDDGFVKHVHLVAHVAWREDGQLEYIGALQDVTQRHHSQDALEKMRSELAHVARIGTLGVLTASIAHEVNQPLAGIITNANTCLRMLGADPPNVEGACETARRAIRDGNRASDVIRRLRSMFSKRELATENINLNDAAREVVAMLLGELQRHKVVIHFDLADDLPGICGDRVQLQQVILNLITNASDAMNDVMDRARQVRICTKRDGIDGVILTVSDCGKGFQEEDANRLFDAFYTTKSSGMGIGLLVSRSIVERHGGRLWAIANEMSGATFAFSIPRVIDDGASGAHAVDMLAQDRAHPPHRINVRS